MKKAVSVILISAACFCTFADNIDSLKTEIEVLRAKLEIQRLTAELNAVQAVQAKQAVQTKQVGQTQAATNVFEVQTEEQKRTIGERIDAFTARVRAAFAPSEEKTQSESQAEAQTLIEDEAQTQTQPQQQADTVSDFRKIVLESRQWRRNHFVGLGGGPGVGAMYLDISPARDLIYDLERSQSSGLYGLGLSGALSSREPAFLIGGFGYGNLGSGAIIGGGGYKFSTSAGHRAPNGVRLNVEIDGGYGGFLFGGNWIKDKNSFALTALIGAGNLMVAVDRRNNWPFGGDDETDILEERATFFAFEPQISFTRSLLQWFHVGVEAGGLLSYSQRGFGWTDGFVTFNPTAKLKFTFGSI